MRQCTSCASESRGCLQASCKSSTRSVEPDVTVTTTRCKTACGQVSWQPSVVKCHSASSISALLRSSVLLKSTHTHGTVVPLPLPEPRQLMLRRCLRAGLCPLLFRLKQAGIPWTCDALLQWRAFDWARACDHEPRASFLPSAHSQAVQSLCTFLSGSSGLLGGGCSRAGVQGCSLCHGARVTMVLMSSRAARPFDKLSLPCPRILSTPTRPSYNTICFTPAEQ